MHHRIDVLDLHIRRHRQRDRRVVEDRSDARANQLVRDILRGFQRHGDHCHLYVVRGELLVQPTAHAMVARFAPRTMRGRYMAIYGFTWPLAQGVGPLAAGLVMDNADPRLVWFAGALLAVAAALGFLRLASQEESSAS